MAYKIVPKIKRKGWPTNSKKWKKAHNTANSAERKANPKLFKAIQKRIATMPSNELAGTHTKSGKIKVSRKFLKKFPKKMRKRVAESIGKIHEPTEHKHMKGKK